MGSSEQDLKKNCAGAEVKKGLALRGSETANSESRVTEWAKKIINE